MRHILTAIAVLCLVTLSGTHVASLQSEASKADTPVVKSGDMPLYPDLWRQARIQGTVRLEVTTDGPYITNVVASGAHKTLLRAAEENIRTWRFYEHRPQTFIVTFVYKLEKEEVPGPV